MQSAKWKMQSWFIVRGSLFVADCNLSNLNEVVRADASESLVDLWEQGLDNGNLIARQRYDRYIDLSQILLMAKIFVGGYKDVEFGGDQSQQLDILDPGPAHVLDRNDIALAQAAF